MGYFSEIDIDNQEWEAINGGSKHDYEPDYTDIKGKPFKSLENALSLSKEQREFIASDEFAKEWDNFLKGSF
jgi:hypothetical protein